MKRQRKSEWVQIEIQRCDFCDKAACYQHPAGGLRCETCPRPESKEKSE